VKKLSQFDICTLSQLGTLQHTSWTTKGMKKLWENYELHKYYNLQKSKEETEENMLTDSKQILRYKPDERRSVVRTM